MKKLDEFSGHTYTACCAVIYRDKKRGEVRCHREGKYLLAIKGELLPLCGTHARRAKGDPRLHGPFPKNFVMPNPKKRA